MASKCDICRAKIEENFLGKIFGAYFKDKKGKKHVICPNCQKKFTNKKEILKNL